MKKTLIAVIALQFASTSYAVSKFEGQWFSCIPEMKGRNNPYTRISIKKHGVGFDVFSETGDKYTFIGTGHLVKNNLVVRGCDYYVDQPTNNCNPEHPPIAFTMKSTIYQRDRAVTYKSLQHSLPIYTLNKDLNALREMCEKLISPESYE